ncbi:MAG: PTS sugar transporter subunit IIC [Coprobacillaceae bacterium]
MNKLNDLLEKYLLPIGNKLMSNRMLTVITKAMMGIFPLTIAGSFALIIQSFPFLDTVVDVSVMDQIYAFLGGISNATLSLIGLFLTGLVGYYYMKEEKIEPIYGAIVAIASFLIITPFYFDEAWAGYIPVEWLGNQGMFTAMIVGILSAMLFARLTNSKATIKLPDAVPPMVSESFKALIPATVTFLAFAAVGYLFTFTSYGNIHSAIFTIIQQPILKIGASLPATLLIVVFVQLLWFMGLHGQNIVGAILNPIWISAFTANLEATTAGKDPTYIFTGTFFSAFIWMQFIALIIACLISAKSAQLKSVGKLSMGSAIFNISEPIVFGAPVVLNITLLIPWVLVMVVCVLITWAFMEFGLCPLTTGADIPWTTPPIISGYLVTGSIMGAVVQIINVIVGVLIYLPFVKVYDKQLLKQEAEYEARLETETMFINEVYSWI